MAKRKLLNVRAHLEHLDLILTELRLTKDKDPISPLLRNEIAKAAFFNKTILKVANKSRKDLRISHG